MPKNKEVEMLIARYRADIAALEDRKDYLMRQIEILENLIPTFLLWYMGKVYQTIESPLISGGIPISQNEVDSAKEKLIHFQSFLLELQQAVELIKEEEEIMKKRIEELETTLSDLPDYIDSSKAVKSSVQDLNFGEGREHSISEGLKDQGMSSGGLSTDDETDWKKVCEELLKQVNELSQKLQNVTHKVEENEDLARHLEKEYAMLEKELQEKILLLENKTDTIISEVINQEQENYMQEELESKEALSMMQGALAEVRSMKESLSKSKTLSKDENVEPPVTDGKINESSSKIAPETQKAAEKDSAIGALPLSDSSASKETIHKPPTVQISSAGIPYTPKTGKSPDEMKGKKKLLKLDSVKSEVTSSQTPVLKGPPSKPTDNQQPQSVKSGMSKTTESSIEISRRILTPKSLDAPSTVSFSMDTIPNKILKFDELLQAEDTDWKKVCEDLLKQVNILNDNLKHSSDVIQEMEVYIKKLEVEYGKLEKELQNKINLLENRTDNLMSGIAGKEKEKSLQEDHESRRAFSEMQEALEEVKSVRESLLKSKTTKDSAEALTTAEGLSAPSEAKFSKGVVSDKMPNFEELLSGKDTDWKKVCNELLNKVGDLSKDLKNSEELFLDMWNHAKQLEQIYSKLDKELQAKIQSLERKADTLIAEIANKEKEKNLQENAESKKNFSVQEAATDVHPLKDPSSKSEILSKDTSNTKDDIEATTSSAEILSTAGNSVPLLKTTSKGATADQSIIPGSEMKAVQESEKMLTEGLGLVEGGFSNLSTVLKDSRINNKKGEHKKKEIEMLIARYKTDISALEEREEYFKRHIEILEGLIPSVLLWCMMEASQSISSSFKQGIQPSQQEITKEARKKLEHFEKLLGEHKQAITLIEEEKKVMMKRIKDLEKLIADQPDQYPDKVAGVIIPEKTKVLESPKTIQKIKSKIKVDDFLESFDTLDLKTETQISAKSAASVDGKVPTPVTSISKVVISDQVEAKEVSSEADEVPEIVEDSEEGEVKADDTGVPSKSTISKAASSEPIEVEKGLPEAESISEKEGDETEGTQMTVISEKTVSEPSEGREQIETEEKLGKVKSLDAEAAISEGKGAPSEESELEPVISEVAEGGKSASEAESVSYITETLSKVETDAGPSEKTPSKDAISEIAEGEKPASEAEKVSDTIKTQSKDIAEETSAPFEATVSKQAISEISEAGKPASEAERVSETIKAPSEGSAEDTVALAEVSASKQAISEISDAEKPASEAEIVKTPSEGIAGDTEIPSEEISSKQAISEISEAERVSETIKAPSEGSAEDTVALAEVSASKQAISEISEDEKPASEAEIIKTPSKDFAKDTAAPSEATASKQVLYEISEAGRSASESERESEIGKTPSESIVQDTDAPFEATGSKQDISEISEAEKPVLEAEGVSDIAKTPSKVKLESAPSEKTPSKEAISVGEMPTSEAERVPEILKTSSESIAEDTGAPSEATASKQATSELAEGEQPSPETEEEPEKLRPFNEAEPIIEDTVAISDETTSKHTTSEIAEVVKPASEAVRVTEILKTPSEDKSILEDTDVQSEAATSMQDISDIAEEEKRFPGTVEGTEKVNSLDKVKSIAEVSSVPIQPTASKQAISESGEHPSKTEGLLKEFPTDSSEKRAIADTVIPSKVTTSKHAISEPVEEEKPSSGTEGKMEKIQSSDEVKAVSEDTGALPKTLISKDTILEPAKEEIPLPKTEKVKSLSKTETFAQDKGDLFKETASEQDTLKPTESKKPTSESEEVSDIVGTSTDVETPQKDKVSPPLEAKDSKEPVLKPTKDGKPPSETENVADSMKTFDGETGDLITPTPLEVGKSLSETSKIKPTRSPSVSEASKSPPLKHTSLQPEKSVPPVVLTDVDAIKPFEEGKVPPKEGEKQVVEDKPKISRTAADGIEAQAIISGPTETSPTEVTATAVPPKKTEPAREESASLAAQTLHDKLLVKDHLIKSMADQLRDLARNNKWAGSKTFEAATSVDPVKTYDFDANSLMQYLKGEGPPNFADIMKSNEKYSSSNPLNVKIVRKLDNDSLLIEWGPPPSDEVVGFQIFVNGQFMYWVHSAKRNMALLHPLDLKLLMDIAVSPINVRGDIVSRSSVTYRPE